MTDFRIDLDGYLARIGFDGRRVPTLETLSRIVLLHQMAIAFENLNPLMGWPGSGDTQSQVRLTFESRDDAKAYAAKYGIAARVYATPPKGLKLQAYADNFR